MTGLGLEPRTNGLTYLIGFRRPPYRQTTCIHKPSLCRFRLPVSPPDSGGSRWLGKRPSARRMATGTARRGARLGTSGGSMASLVRRQWLGSGELSPVTLASRWIRWGGWGIIRMRALELRQRTNEHNKHPLANGRRDHRVHAIARRRRRFHHSISLLSHNLSSSSPS
jgi:hypothetical protein